MLTAAVQKIRDHHEELSKLDAATGDGDHGTTMLRVMEAVDQEIKESADSDIKSLLYNIGWGIISVDGGATGPLLGTFFMGMSEGAADNDNPDSDTVAKMFKAGLTRMQKLSKAKIGDKTMMDALIPAIEELQESTQTTSDIAEMMKKTSQAAVKGAQSTKQLQARCGRARNLNERTIGHIDPGSRSISYIFEGFSEAISGK